MKRKITRYLILALALVLIAIGIAQGDFRETRHRAINICLECVGIG